MGSHGVAKWRWWVVVVAWTWGAAARTLCPARCACDDALRAASCANASLEIVPIQLNPEATHINLTHNSISNLLYTFPFYTQLTVLDISHNKIQDLGRECEMNMKKSDNSSVILKIDYEDVKCAAPEHLKGDLLVPILESEFGCSNGWVIVAVIVMTVSIIISLVGGGLYFMGPLKKCKGDKSKQVMTSVMLNSDVSKLGNGLGYSTRSREQENKRDVDRYLMIGSSVTNNFHSLNPPWHSVDKNPYYQEDSEEHIYQQFAYETIPHHRTPEKPHIVYV
ncbi:unnamed protein product, partial [Iphiclides podalirius]